MTRDEFVDTMRMNRGRLTAKHTVANMDAIYVGATAKFVYFMLNTKKIGIDKAADYTDRLTVAQQDELIDWLDTQPTTIKVATIDVKVSSILAKATVATVKTI